jgi:hypothetical protein
MQQPHGFAAIGAAEYIFNSLPLLINRTKVKLRYFNAPTDSNTFSVTLRDTVTAVRTSKTKTL